MDDNQDNRIDKVITVSVEEEMKKSYIDYAMSVIVARALPDVRDGLKPVHRRILFAMNELNLDPSKGHKKSMRIVGDTMGKYHPHGNTSIYDAMARMAQDFSMRYMLVDGHGNFGSIDGDSPAAERYTEARLSRMAMEMLNDIEKDTVDFVPNYDEEFQEPTVLPSRFPNLLANGSSGIAVGMATNIPPHNLREVIDGVIKIIDNHTNEDRETDIEELLEIIKAPDYPTGASILGTYGIKTAYRTGKGKVVVRAKAEIEAMTNNRDMIIVTELPYQVNKANLVEKIGELVNEKKIEGISDIRDESNRKGIRIVIELKRDGNANVILNQLYKFSQMQVSYGINMLALVKNVPKILNLKEMLTHYLEHQKEVITRRTAFELRKAEKRAHILEGFLKALDNIDEVLNIIRSSKDTSTAKERLIERFEFSDEQVSAIVELRFRSLTGMEREKIQTEHLELIELIKELVAILSDDRRLYSVIREELLIIKAKYGDDRRTDILHDPGELLIEDLIDEEDSVITLSYLDYVKRVPLNTYKSQRRGGKGVIGVQMRDEDLVKNLFIANTHDHILFFTNLGRVYRKKAFEIPESGRTARGLAIINLLNLESGEKIAAVMPVRTFDDNNYIVMVTRKGVIKKSSLSLFDNIKKSGIIAIKFREDDELISVLRTDGDKEIFLATQNGYGLRFNENEIRSVGRMAAGVRAIRLRGEDNVVSSDTLEPDSKLLFVSEKGYGKCTVLNEFISKHRGGMGFKIYRITEKTGNLICVSKVNDREEIMLINSEGVVIRIRVTSISNQGRVAQGVKLINLEQGVKVVTMAKISEDQIQDEMDDEEVIEEMNIEIESEIDSENEPIENEPLESVLLENEPTENEPLESEALENEPTENQPFESKALENELLESGSTENEPLGSEALENEPLENESPENEPLE